jgi:hypothetical protein
MFDASVKLETQISSNVDTSQKNTVHRQFEIYFRISQTLICRPCSLKHMQDVRFAAAGKIGRCQNFDGFHRPD